MKTNPTCRKCGVELNSENWYPSCQKRNNRICKRCQNTQVQQYQKANPDKAKATWTHNNRKHGNRPMSKNKECSAYLGVYVAGGVLSHVFKDVQRMPNGNPGFNFICNKGKKISTKSSCLGKYGTWMFSTNHNKIADYFLCLAFDSREDLNPLHAWLIPGEKLNHLKLASIRPSTIHKWDEYKLDITKIITRCDVMHTTYKSSIRSPMWL